MSAHSVEQTSDRSGEKDREELVKGISTVQCGPPARAAFATFAPYFLSIIVKTSPFFSESHNKTHQVTLGLGASDRRSICSSGTSCVASSVIVSVAVAAAPAFAAPPPPPPPEEEAAPAAAGGCPLGGAEARSVRDVTDPCRPWPALLLLPLPSILVGVDEVRLCFVLMSKKIAK